MWWQDDINPFDIEHEIWFNHVGHSARIMYKSCLQGQHVFEVSAPTAKLLALDQRTGAKIAHCLSSIHEHPDDSLSFIAKRIVCYLKSRSHIFVGVVLCNAGFNRTEHPNRTYFVAGITVITANINLPFGVASCPLGQHKRRDNI